ncbi:MAG: NADH-quinone oxidoreductase subunit L [Acidobacteria bacterium]|nr:NADH-quinone oxidoreductase subunit L [Acidobacteriota bacterium]MBI3655180.1 NADH-quinone oxidoreductase subunit L [Acidobacteriota bacterium]
MANYFWLIPFIPLAGTVINGLFGKRLSKKVVGLLACTSVGLACLLSLWAVLHLTHLPPNARRLTHILFTWIASGDFHVEFQFLLDPLSAVMILVVTFVGFWIHVYATGYMAHDDGYYRFFAFLNLFMFAMLTLVLAGNFLLMFVGWEGVGLCSYLLIGYYFHKKSAGDAAKKAFIVNRVGDIGFVLGILLVYVTFQTLDFTSVFNRAAGFLVEESGGGVLTVITLLLFVGAVGKSAQIPLYVWLPDAMEGPTPVSALIHAATMVTAGVYMVARCNPLFSRAPLTMEVVTWVGAATALFAATIGLVQRDIKRILAYSTVSQLGYMFVAMGVGAFTAGMFHLVTHAFFKALLFLGAGSVITAFHHQEQDITRMGGLHKYMPITARAMTIGALTLAGCPLLSGFFSKDEILWQAVAGGHLVPWIVVWLAAGCTAFYIFRLLFLTFFGEARMGAAHAEPCQESPRRMTTPLIVLALFSVGIGYIGLPPLFAKVFHLPNVFEHFLEPVWQGPPRAPSAPVTVACFGQSVGNGEGFITLLSILMALAGFLTAWLFYLKQKDWPELLSHRLSGLYHMLLNKYKIDEIYDTVIINPINTISYWFLWQFFDVGVIDGIVNRTGQIMRGAGRLLKNIQSGYTRSYAAWILFGVVAILVYCMR